MAPMRCLQISALSVAIAGTWATTANAVIKSEVCVQVGTSTVCAVLLGTTECWNEPINECNYSYLLEPSDLEFLFHGNQQVDILDGFGDVSAGDGDGIADDNVKSQTTNKDPCNDAGQSGANAPTVATTLGNPVDISNGQKIETERDFESRGEVPLMLERQYRSYNERDGLFGRYWESNFDHYLWMDGANRIVHIPGRGSFRFTPDASSPNTFRPAGASAQALLVKLTDGSYTLTWDGDTVQRYTSDGRVL